MKIEDLAKQNHDELRGQDVTFNGYLIKKAEEPLEDGYNYPFIDNDMNGVLVKSKSPLNELQTGKWFDVKGKIDTTNHLELHVASNKDVRKSEDQSDSPSLSRRFSSSVKSVVDGDTLHLQKPVLGATKVRLVSIDTPETNYQGDSQGYYAEEATRVLKDLLKEGDKVDISVGDDPFDQYGRLLAIVIEKKENINKELIAKGMAVPYFIYPNLENFEEYGKTVVKAKECGKGLWNPDRPIDELPYEFRFNKRGGPNKFVGNYQTKEYVEPEKWESVAIENRVFFLKENHAKQAGYSKKTQDDSTC